MSVAKLPMIDPEAAAAELRRARHRARHGRHGHAAARAREEPRRSRASTSCGATAEDLGVAVCVHGGGQAIDQVPIGVDRWNTRLEVHAFTHPVGQMIAVMAFTVGGILHRFPKLRVAFLEAGTRLAAVLARAPRRALGADARAGAEHRPQAERVLPVRPLLHRLRPRREGRRRTSSTALGEDVVVYASDYCHWDCKFPDTVKIVDERTDLSASAKRKILDDNPRRLYARRAEPSCRSIWRRCSSRRATALLMMECQEGIIGEGGTLVGARRRRARATARSAQIARVLAAARAQGVPVFHCTMARRPDGGGAAANCLLLAATRKSARPLLPGSPQQAPVARAGAAPTASGWSRASTASRRSTAPSSTSSCATSACAPSSPPACRSTSASSG